MKFRLLEKDAQGNKVGPHREGSKRYKAGDVLESDRPLDRIFRGKFEQVLDQGTAVSKPEIVRLPRMLTRNKAEAVVDAGMQGVASQEPPAPPSQEQTRETLFGAKETWKGLQPSTGATPLAKVTKSKHGADVTDEFPDAELAGMKVFHNIKTDSYIIVDVKSEEVLKRAKSEKLVGKFIKSQLG